MLFFFCLLLHMKRLDNCFTPDTLLDITWAAQRCQRPQIDNRVQHTRSEAQQSARCHAVARRLFLHTPVTTHETHGTKLLGNPSYCFSFEDHPPISAAAAYKSRTVSFWPIDQSYRWMYFLTALDNWSSKQLLVPNLFSS